MRIFGQLGKFSLELLQHLPDGVDIKLHLFMVAMIGLGDQLIDPTLGNLIENAVALANRQQNGIEHFVKASQKLGVFTAKGCDIGSLAQLSVLRCLDQTQHLLRETLIGAFAQPRLDRLRHGFIPFVICLTRSLRRIVQ